MEQMDKIDKMDKKEVHRKALGKLRFYQKRGLSIDKLSDIFHTFINEFYDIEHELTNEELHALFSRRKAQKKDELLMLLRKLDHLKYHIETPSEEEIKELSHGLIDYIEKIEVYENEKKESFWKRFFRRT